MKMGLDKDDYERMGLIDSPTQEAAPERIWIDNEVSRLDTAMDCWVDVSVLPTNDNRQHLGTEYVRADLARVHQPPEQNLEDKNSGEPKPKAPSHSSVVVLGDSSESAAERVRGVMRSAMVESDVKTLESQLNNILLNVYDLTIANAPISPSDCRDITDHIGKNVGECRKTVARLTLLTKPDTKTSEASHNPELNQDSPASLIESSSPSESETLVTVDETELEECLRMENESLRAELGQIYAHELRGGNKTVLALLAEQLCQQLRTVHASDEHRSVWETAQLHRGQYSGPTYTKQLEALERAILNTKSAELSVHQPDVQAADVAQAIADCEEGRLSHLHWAEHFEAHPELEKQYEQTGEWDTAKVHREWVAKYDNIISLLKRVPALAASPVQSEVSKEQDNAKS